MGKKLSIQQRQYNQTGWHKSSQFSSTDIKEIKVSRAKNDKSINAIPSPFARIHLLESAFDLLDKDERNNTDLAGDTYKKLVSDCFDIFELIYNWNTHLKEGKKLKIITWDKEAELNELINSNSKKHKLIADTLQVYLKQDSFEKLNEILIVTFDGMPIAGSSPFSGFFPSPTASEGIKLFNPINKRDYFTHIIPFPDRKPEIRKYIYDFFYHPDFRFLDSLTTVKNYLHEHRSKIAQGLDLKLEQLKSQGTKDLVLLGQLLMTNAAKTEVDYFEDYIIKIPYNLNSEYFVVPRNNVEREYDFLLPFKPAFFADYPLDGLESRVSLKDFDESTIEISILLGNGNKISKKYQRKKFFDNDGQIVDFESIKFNIGIFPFVKVVDPLQQNDFNDFFKIVFISQDNSYVNSNSDYNLVFYKDQEVIESTGVYNIKRDERTIFKRDRLLVGSTYYSMNTIFDFIQVQLPDLIGNTSGKIANVIVPKWPIKEVGKNRIDYSVDFGTTTTFLAYTDDPEHKREPRPFELTLNEVPIQFINKPRAKRPQFKGIDIYETAISHFFPESMEVQKQEMIPSVISNDEKYRLPLRTVLYQKKNISASARSLFSSTNISFNYQKEFHSTTGLDQEFKTNLKWNINNDEDSKKSIELFLEELFFLIRIKTIYLNGDPRKTNISWFYPLSFTPNAKNSYSRIWNNLAARILKVNNEDQVKKITESEAPFYYLFKNATISDSKYVLTLDIGGGSTDLMYFRDQMPTIGTSVHFGANVLWGNGWNEFSSDKSNGIYKSIKDSITMRLGNMDTGDLETLNEDFTKEGSNYGSDEIINFWLVNEQQSKVSEELEKEDFKLTYLIHFSAIIFHSFKLLSTLDQPCPTCIIFSGNGSRYLDLIQEKVYIQRICEYFAARIFGTEFKSLQIILPATNRKEATCFGGLYQPPEHFATFNQTCYLGWEKQQIQETKYSVIDRQKDYILNELNVAFSEFVDMFFQMNESPKLNFKTDFGVKQKLSAVKNYILANSLDNLTLGYGKRRNKVESDDVITDSLFFYPLIGLIYKLNTISKTDLEGFLPKVTLYAFSSEPDGLFVNRTVKERKQADSIFEIILDDSIASTGELTVIDDPLVHRRAIGSISNFLRPVCEFQRQPTNAGQNIQVLSPGLVERTSEGWKIVKKIRINFE